MTEKRKTALSAPTDTKQLKDISNKFILSHH